MSLFFRRIFDSNRAISFSNSATFDFSSASWAVTSSIYLMVRSMLSSIFSICARVPTFCFSRSLISWRTASNFVFNCSSSSCFSASCENRQTKINSIFISGISLLQYLNQLCQRTCRRQSCRPKTTNVENRDYQKRNRLYDT